MVKDSARSTAARHHKPLGQHRRLHEMYFPKQLLSVIRRERARADRQKGRFTLVMFRPVPAKGRWATLRLSRVVLDQMRATDEIGQFDRHTVCVILPDTAPEGAMKLIERVSESAKSRGMGVEPTVYTYPTDWLNSRHSDDSDRNNSDPPSDSDPSRVAEWVRRAETTGSSGSDPHLNIIPLESLLEQRPGKLKRMIDIVVASMVLIVAWPVMVLIAILIKLTSEGPVIFKQWRSGLGGRPFEIYKFRTMCVNADSMKAQLRSKSEQDGPAFKMTHDPRVTRIGALLRKTSLDELPQLFNVLKGDMSLVGPRPLPLDEQAQCDQWHRGRLDVIPGLTCIWQVKGRSRVSFEEWMRMDLSYIKRYRVWEDLKLIFATVPAVILRRGAK
ncbi:MAG: spore coat protein CotZ [Phycisphaerae bacterium]|nr:MAG: spore coat protein CotZ [Phycisphaerae bacterium]